MKHQPLNTIIMQGNKKRYFPICINTIFLTFILSVFFSHDGFAQANGSNYKTAIGVKFYPTGVTLKTFVRSNAAFEAIGYFWDREMCIRDRSTVRNLISGLPTWFSCHP